MSQLEVSFNVILINYNLKYYNELKYFWLINYNYCNQMFLPDEEIKLNQTIPSFYYSSNIIIMFQFVVGYDCCTLGLQIHKS